MIYKKVSTSLPYFCSFLFPEVLFFFSALWTFWHLSLTTLILDCCLPTHYIVRASPARFDNRKLVGNFNSTDVFDCLIVFLRETVCGYRALSMWPKFLTTTPDPPTNGEHLPILALCAHSASASHRQTMGSPIPGKGSPFLPVLHVKVHTLV